MMAAAPRIAVRTGTPPAVMSPRIFQRNISTRSHEPSKAPKIAPTRPYGVRPCVIRSATNPQTAAIRTSTTRFSRFIQTPPPRVTARLPASCRWRPSSTDFWRRRDAGVTAAPTLPSPQRGRGYSGLRSGDNQEMPQLGGKARAQLPDSAFAYIDSGGRRRLPINDEAHVRNALSRFNQTAFEDEAARDRARTRLLKAAKKFGIVPIGFMTGQLRSQTTVAMRTLPTGVVTFLLADIADSTGLVRTLGDGYGGLLA